MRRVSLWCYYYRIHYLSRAARFNNQRQYNTIQASKSVVIYLCMCATWCLIPESLTRTLLTCLNSDRSSHTSSRRIDWDSLHGRISPSHGTVEKWWRSIIHNERGENGRSSVRCCSLYFYLLLRPTILRKMECIDAVCSIQLVDIIPGESLGKLIFRLWR